MPRSESVSPPSTPQSGYLVSILINQARELPAGDLNGSCDAYVIASIGDVQKRTRSISHSRNPAWNARLNLLVDEVATDSTISFTVMDDDLLSRDDLLCTATVSVPGEDADDEFQWLILKDAAGKEAGRLQVSVLTKDRSGAPKEEMELLASSHLLEVELGSLRGLSCTGPPNSEFSCRVSFGKRRFTTKPVLCDAAAAFNEKMSVWVDENVESKYVVMLHLLRGDAEVFASTSVSIEELFRKDNTTSLQAWLPLTQEIVQEDSQLDQLEQEVVSGASGRLSIGEIHVNIAAISRDDAEKKLMRRLLADFDEDNLGSMSKSQFQAMLTTLGMLLDGDTVDTWFDAADRNGDGRLSTDELMGLLHSARFDSLGLLPELLKCSVEMSAMKPSATTGTLSSIPAARARGIVEVRDRVTGVQVVERIPGYIKLAMQAMFGNSIGQVFTSKGRALLTKASKLKGWQYDDPSSVSHIPKFIQQHNLNVDEIELPLSEYKTFNEFFSRGLKKTARPLSSPGDDNVAVSPADCRLTVFPTVHRATELWIKGEKFSVDRLLGPDVDSTPFLSGSVAISRLSPQDYHRWHMPVAATVLGSHDISGALYTVNPIAVNSVANVYTANKRSVVELESPEFGRVALVAVGATMVGSIAIHGKPGDVFARGDEHGRFFFGGSTVILLFERGRIEFDRDLILNSNEAIETLVRVRTAIGRAVKPTKPT